MGVDAVACADARLQRARGGVSGAHRVQAIERARAPHRGRHGPVTRVDKVGITTSNRTTLSRQWGRRGRGARELDLTLLDRLDRTELGSGPG